MKTDYPRPASKRTEPFWKELNKVTDPEINLGIVDLGLIYDIKINKTQKATVDMTLTTPSCPYAPMIIQDVDSTMRKIKGIKDVEIRIVWEPIWTDALMDPNIKLMFT
jgi:metal-sulfur cluster biosynthetic enzyme